MKTPQVSNQEIAEYKKNHDLIVEFLIWGTKLKKGKFYPHLELEATNFLKHRSNIKKEK